MAKTFAPLGDARYKITGGKIVQSREMYFAIYQSIAEDASRPGLYKEFVPEFFDLIIIDECHLAFNAPLRTRRERSQRLRTDRADFFGQFGAEARAILDELFDKYTEHGTAQFIIPDVLEVPPISQHGNVIEIAKRFGGVEELRKAIIQLQTLLYAAA